MGKLDVKNMKQAAIPIRLCVRESTLRARGPFSEELGTAVRLLRSRSSSWKRYILCTMIEILLVLEIKLLISNQLPLFQDCLH